MLLMFEREIRGGITQAVYCYALANNPYMGDQYDPSEESSYLQYLDETSCMDGRCHNCFQLEDLDGLTLSPMKFKNSQNVKTKVTY